MNKVKNYLSQNKNISFQELEEKFKNEYGIAEMDYIYTEKQSNSGIINSIIIFFVLLSLGVFIIYIFGDSYTQSVIGNLDSLSSLKIAIFFGLIPLTGLLIIALPKYAYSKQSRLTKYIYNLLGVETNCTYPSNDFNKGYFGIAKAFIKNLNGVNYKIEVQNTDITIKGRPIPEFETYCYLFLTTDLKKNLPNMICKRKLFELSEWKGDVDLETNNNEFYKNYRVFTSSATTEQMQKVMNDKIINYILRPEILKNLKFFAIENGNITFVYRIRLLRYTDLIKDYFRLKFFSMSFSNYSKVYKDFSEILEFNKNILSML